MPMAVAALLWACFVTFCSLALWPVARMPFMWPKLSPGRLCGPRLCALLVLSRYIPALSFACPLGVCFDPSSGCALRLRSGLVLFRSFFVICMAYDTMAVCLAPWLGRALLLALSCCVPALFSAWPLPVSLASSLGRALKHCWLSSVAFRLCCLRGLWPYLLACV